VLVVVASSRDRIAAQAVAYWGADRARLLTCGDLSRSGWRYRPGAAGRSVAMIAGERVRAAEIEGVLVRLPYVGVEELPHIVPGDRSYVAQEMTAFLTAWLAELPCPVVNRPSADCLGGPGWGMEQWLHVAAGLGLPVRRRRGIKPRRSDALVTVVGRHTFGFQPEGAAAHGLAVAAATDLLDVYFELSPSGPRVVTVNPWPDVSRPEVAEALLECWRGP
jgi:hypothetical protein